MLESKVVLLTGGTGAIGSAYARLAVAYGADLAFTYNRQEARAQALLEELSASGRRVICDRVRAAERKEVDDFVARTERELGRIDVLVNNIGATQVMPFALIEESDWDEMVQVNLKSLFLFSRASVRGMIRRKGGCILNIGSIAGQRLLEVPVHYATAKAGVTGFTVSMAKEMARYGVRVNAIIPGLIEGGIGSNVSERQLAQYNEYCSLGRPGTPREVAELMAFLSSDRASYINAQCFVIDGGL